MSARSLTTQIGDLAKKVGLQKERSAEAFCGSKAQKRTNSLEDDFDARDGQKVAFKNLRRSAPAAAPLMKYEHSAPQLKDCEERSDYLKR